jgi:arylsulfatase A-like enzyme
MATGYAGDANARTPWLDGLAAEAVDFTQATTPHPLGPQARAALLTGKLCPENGVRGYWDALPAGGRTIAHALNDRGYATAWFGKWHLAERDRTAPLVDEAHAKMIVPPERRGGFALWEGFESGFLLNAPWLHGTRLPQPKQFRGYQADVLCQRAAEWMSRPRSLPQFCVVSLETPHPPYHAPAPHVAERKPAEIVLRGNVPLGGEAEKKVRGELAGYYAHIEATDRAIGRLIAEVDLSETVVVFTSVHGDMHGSHGVFRKAWPYDESVRVPLLVRFPRREAPSSKLQIPRKDGGPVSLVDLPHMAVAWAEGREWRLKRDHAPISMPTAGEVPGQCPEVWRGFRTAEHKVVLKTEADGQERPWMYFDLRRDPLEMKNLAGDAARAGELRELMKWL